MINTVRQSVGNDLEGSYSFFEIKNILGRRLARNDDSGACDSILQIGHLLGCNQVK